MKKIFCLFFCFLSFSIAKSQQKGILLSDLMKREVVEISARKLIENYIFEDTAKRMADFIEKKLKSGGYDTIKNAKVFAQQLTTDIYSIYHDGHFRIGYSPKFAEGLEKNVDSKTQEAQELEQAREKNFGIIKSEVLSNGMGYIKINRFYSLNEESKAAIKAALKPLANTKALIFDFRDHIGGDAEMVNYLSGFFFEKPTHLNDLYERRNNSIENYTTKPDYSFPKFLSIPIYVLTSKITFSGGEGFAYGLQAMKRATIIGEITGGGAHPVEPLALKYGFVISMPYERAINPITKKNWEGTGVIPDIITTREKAEQAIPGY